MRPSPCAGVETSSDDMLDSPEDLRIWKGLSDVLAICQREITTAFVDADEEANHRQWQHKFLMVAAAAAGTVAVIVAILQLTELRNGFVPMPILEGVLALIAISAVAAGVWSKRQPGWFLSRHQAERCRFLKFRFLINPALWMGARTQQAEHLNMLQQDVDDIRWLDRKGCKKFAEGGMMPEVPARGPSCLASPEELRELIDYYIRKRLCNQMNWFNKRAQQLSHRDRILKHLPPWLFFGSVCAALAHFTYDELVHLGAVPAQVVVRGVTVEVSVALILVAAILPVLGGGFRTLRSAAQFARNTSRYTAALKGLKPSFEVLRAEQKKLQALGAGKGQVSAYDIFYHMWRCEQILEAEHREWLRLMMQAEWFG
ncbi:MAG: hypothetical protein WBZ42_00710 [Halobacteriota archaeon]